MSLSIETKLDYDRTVGTEDRFAIRKVVDQFVAAVNQGNREVYEKLISDGITIEGFSDIPQVKQGFTTMLERRFKGNGLRFMRFPILKLSFSRYLYHLEGTYEEFIDGILATEGTIELMLIKNEIGYQLVKIIFYPRMRLSEEEL